MASSDKKPDKKHIKSDLSTFAQKPNGFWGYVTFEPVENVLHPGKKKKVIAVFFCVFFAEMKSVKK